MKTSIAINEIIDLSMKVLQKYGVSTKDAKIVIDHLLGNELSGQPSHGFYKIPGIVRAIQETGDPNQITLEKETNNSVLINGGKHLGLVVVSRAIESIIEKLGVNVKREFKKGSIGGKLRSLTNKLKKIMNNE